MKLHYLLFSSLLSVSVLANTSKKSAVDLSKMPPLPAPIVSPQEKFELATQTYDRIPEHFAIIDKQPIDKTQIKSHLKSFFRNSRAKISNKQAEEAAKSICQNFLEKTVLLKLAKEKNIPDPTASEVEAQINQTIKRFYKTKEDLIKDISKDDLTFEKFQELISENLKIQELIQQEISKYPITDEEIEIFYNNNRKQFISPQQVNASHILIKVAKDASEDEQKLALEKISKLRSSILQGNDFAEIAKKESDCPSKNQGGNLGFFSRGQMVKPFEHAAFNLKSNEVSDVVKTNFGYHIIKCNEIKNESTKPLSEVSDAISRLLQQAKREKITKEILNNAIEKYDAKLTY